MIRLLLLMAMLLPAVVSVRAQDVQGIELCTRETRMDRRTGCLQSNIEYLHKLIAANAGEAQRKLNAAAGEISALKATVAALQAGVEKLQASIDKLQAPASKPDAAKPNAK